MERVEEGALKFRFALPPRAYIGTVTDRFARATNHHRAPPTKVGRTGPRAVSQLRVMYAAAYSFFTTRFVFNSNAVAGCGGEG